MSVETARSTARRCLVISGVNFTEGGPLTVFRDFVDAACRVLPDEWQIVVFAHNVGVLNAQRARIIAIPYAKKSWLRRLWVEWHEFSRYARQIGPDLWVSMHDMSPNVGGVPQVVYCHNPAPFLRVRLMDAIFEPSLLLFRLAYAGLYRINLKRNLAVVVQQSWLRDEFRKWVGAATQIIVAHPTTRVAGTPPAVQPARRSGPATFLYPALPRAFKNIELLCRALKHLEKEASWESTLILTIDGTENRYAGWLKKRFGNLATVRFTGRQTREQMQRLYQEADCLLFPSRLETWGLPISEAKQQGLPMLVADLPYAKEAVGDYTRAEFIDPEDDRSLAAKLLAFQLGTLRFRGASGCVPAAPFAPDWTSLIVMLQRLVP
jgi:glycosyltransferase involved in cell wall biosynthesis